MSKLSLGAAVIAIVGAFLVSSVSQAQTRRAELDHIGIKGPKETLKACTVNGIETIANGKFGCDGSRVVANGTDKQYDNSFMVTAQCEQGGKNIIVSADSSLQLALAYSQAIAAQLSGSKLIFKDAEGESCGGQAYWEAVTIRTLTQ